jgi:phage-related protein
LSVIGIAAFDYLKTHIYEACPVKESYEGNAYRAVYTVRYAAAVYVLHAFQKKSKKGIATPKAEMDLIEKRMKDLVNEKERQ